MIVYELFGGIGTEITSASVRDMLKAANGEDVKFLINSPGGSVDHGFTIYDLIRSYKGETIAEVLGYTASAGTVVAVACDKVYQSDNALFLVHHAWTQLAGNAGEMRTKAAGLDKADKIMIKIYMERTGKTEAEVRDILAKEDWLTADEAKDLGFIDGIVKSATADVAAYSDGLSNYLQTKLQNKMNIFGKKKVANTPAFLLSFKDGKQILANEEEPKEGTEVSPLGADTLEDGEYELADGSMIRVEGGLIVEVIEVAAEEPEEKEEEEEASAAIIDAVASMIAEHTEAVTALIDVKIKEVKASVSSTHTPAKNKKVDELKTPTINAGVNALNKAKEIKNELRKKLQK